MGEITPLEACLGAHDSSGAVGKKVIPVLRVARELSPENSRARTLSSVPNMAEIGVVLDTCCFSVNSGAGCYDVVNSLEAVFCNGSGVGYVIGGSVRARYDSEGSIGGGVETPSRHLTDQTMSSSRGERRLASGSTVQLLLDHRDEPKSVSTGERFTATDDTGRPEAIIGPIMAAANIERRGERKFFRIPDRGWQTRTKKVEKAEHGEHTPCCHSSTWTDLLRIRPDGIRSRVEKT